MKAEHGLGECYSLTSFIICVDIRFGYKVEQQVVSGREAVF